MATERKQHTRIMRDGKSIKRERVVEHKRSIYQVIVQRITQLLWLTTAIIVSLIAIRFSLKLLAANPDAAFARAIYQVTESLVSPFTGLLESPTFEGGAILEVASIFALIVYLMVALMLITLFQILFSAPKQLRYTSTSEQHLKE